MQVLVRSKDFPVSAALQDFTERQARRLQKHSQRLIRIETFVEKTRAQTRATIRAVMPGKDVVVAHKSTDVYLAIQEAFDRASRALRKNNERWRDRRKSVHHPTTI